MVHKLINKGELVARFKIRFGSDMVGKIFNTNDYTVETDVENAEVTVRRKV